MDLEVQFQNLQENQDRILNMLSEMEVYSRPSFELYTFDEIAQLFSVTKRTIYNWKEEGILPFIMVGSKSYVTEAQLQDFILDHEVKPISLRRTSR